MEVALNLEELKQIAETEQEAVAPLEHTVRVCVAASCLSSRSDQVKAALESEVKAHGLEHKCKVKGVGCMGLCAAGPLVEVHGDHPTMYQSVTAEDATAIVESLGKEPVARLVLPTDSAILLGAEEDRAGELGHHRSRAHRGLHCRWRIRVAGDCADHDDAARSHRRSEEERTARTRRSGLSDGPEVEHGTEGRQ